MNALDVFFIILIIIRVLESTYRGFFKALLADVLLVVAFFVTLIVLPLILKASFIPLKTISPLSQIIAFFILFFILFFLAKVLFRFISKIFSFPRGIIVRILGFIMGLIESAVLIFIISIFLKYNNIHFMDTFTTNLTKHSFFAQAFLPLVPNQWVQETWTTILNHIFFTS